MATTDVCEACHGGSAGVTWQTSVFDHDHGEGTCESCHDNVIATGKGLTHILTTHPCEVCHNTITWQGSFDHSTVVGETCVSCHNGSTATGKSVEHIDTTDTCEACHGVDVWVPALKVDHDQVQGSCITCHDGTIALDSYGGATGGTGEFIDDIAGGARVYIGTDLSNDHPISITYDATLASTDGGLHDPTTTSSGITGGSTITADLLFSGQVQCATCHDVHNGAGLSKLLRISNAASALCLTCHDK